MGKNSFGCLVCSVLRKSLAFTALQATEKYSKLMPAKMCEDCRHFLELPSTRLIRDRDMHYNNLDILNQHVNFLKSNVI